PHFGSLPLFGCPFGKVPISGRTQRSGCRVLFASDPGPTLCFDLARVLMEIGLVSVEDDFSGAVLRRSRSGDYANWHPDFNSALQVDDGRILRLPINLRRRYR